MPDPAQATADQGDQDQDQGQGQSPVVGALPGTLLQRQCAGCRAEEEQAGHAPPARAPRAVDVTPVGGEALDPALRAYFEPRFGHSFGGVRVHTDGRAAEAARAVNALAYTVGTDIAFGAGQYAPGTAQGRRLLAHELAHVVQQSGGALGAAPAAAGAGRVARLALTPSRSVLQRWSVDGPAPANTNTIVCDGSGNVKVQSGGTGNAEQTALLGDCIRKHEESHMGDAVGSNATLCKDKAGNSQVVFSAGEQTPSEVKASNVEINCLKAKLPTGDTKKDKIINDRVTQMVAYRDSFH
jgi:hypothetical protein